ncbi:MAG: hypothetical protein J6X08_07455 [Lachnospiraceae bacterium]|nr:hypothetical protein [Lachnospiraceae bacterium]
MERALNICDQAILIINASDGVQAHTKTVWKLLRERHIPTFIFVNKIDLPGFDKERPLSNLKKELSPEATDFSAIHTEQFYEDVATASEDLLESYMDRGSLTDEEIRGEIAQSRVFPVFFGSALKGDGVSEFMDALKEYSIEASSADSFGAVCLKITRDKAGNRLTHLKLTGGTRRVKDVLAEEKVNEIRLYSGEKYEAVSEANATDIVAVTGLKNSRPGAGKSQYQMQGPDADPNKLLPAKLPAPPPDRRLPDNIIYSHRYIRPFFAYNVLFIL